MLPEHARESAAAVEIPKDRKQNNIRLKKTEARAVRFGAWNTWTSEVLQLHEEEVKEGRSREPL